MSIVSTVGIDLAKNVFSVHGIYAGGVVLMRRTVSRSKLSQLIAQLPPCLIGMEACSGAHEWARPEWAVNLGPCTFGMEACSTAHHWARFLSRHGHTARLMAAEFVAPFRKSQGAKNDRNDAQAILVAVRQPDMRFVSAKSVDQQAMLAWHRARSGYQMERTALLNRTRGLLAEFGIWIGRSTAVLIRSLPELREDPRLPEHCRPIFSSTLEHLNRLAQCIEECDKRIHSHVRINTTAKRLCELTGVGELTASAVLATVPNARDFKNGRQMSAWVGLVPRQNSSGGKQRLGVITKRGDSYLRGLLTQGARSTLQVALKREPLKRSRLEQWIVALHARVGYHKTLVAIANKHTRILWAILAQGEAYDPNAWRRHTPKRAPACA